MNFKLQAYILYVEHKIDLRYAKFLIIILNTTYNWDTVVTKHNFLHEITMNEYK